MHVRCYLRPALGRMAVARLSAADVERALSAFLATGRPDRPAKRGRGRQNAAGVSAQVSGTSARPSGGPSAMRSGTGWRDATRPPTPGRPGLSTGPSRTSRRPTSGACSTRPLRTNTGPCTPSRQRPGSGSASCSGSAGPTSKAGCSASGARWPGLPATAGLWPSPNRPDRDERSPLPARARQAIETQRTRQRFAKAAAGSAWQDRDGLVFTDAVGRPLRPEAVSRTFGKARDRAGVPRVRFHDLRHSAATALLSTGVPLAVISEWLGHAGIAITASTYAAVVPELLTEAADAMDRALSGGAS